MKPKKTSLLSVPLSLAAISLVFSTGAVQAATQTYLDTSGLNTWNITDANWDAGVVWTNGNDAVFGGTGESVTVTAATANSITFNSTGYTLTGGTITLGASPTTITANSDATIASALSTSTGVTKAGSGVLTFNNQKTYTGNTTINSGVLDLTGGGGASGSIRGTATVNSTGTLRLSNGDATGYGGGATALTTINLNGGTMSINTTANQTLGSATINMTGGSITGVASSNLDFFNGGSKLNTFASSNASTISGTKVNLRQNSGVTFTVADGAAANDLDVSSVISNSTGFTNNNLIKAGPGTMRLTGANTYTTSTVIAGGTLALGGGGSIASSALVAIAGGTTLDVSGLGTPTFTLGTGKNMGVGSASGLGGIGTASINGDLTLIGPNTLSYAFGQPNSCDLLSLTGAGRTLNLSGTTTITPTGGYVANGTYTLINGAAAITGTPNLVLGGLGTSSRGTTTASFTTTAPVVTMTVSGGTPLALSWKGTASGAWDVNTTANWQNPTPAADTFYNLDAVTFSDSPTTSAVTLGVAVAPGSVTFNNTTTTAYTISGAGSIAGVASVAKTGNGTVFFTNTGNNSYSGGTTISGGILSLGNGANENVNGLGTGPVTINTGGTLQMLPGGSAATFNIPNAINLNGGTVWAQDGLQRLAGTVNVGSNGGSLRPYWDTKSLWIDGVLSGSGPLTISTPNNNTDGVHFTNPANTYSGNITVTSTNAKLDHNNALSQATITVSATNGLQFGSGVTAPAIGALAGASATSIAGVNLSVGGNNSTTTYSGALSGTGGSLTKTGTGAFTLSGANTYTGLTSVSGGTLNVNNTLQSTSGLTVGTGAVANLGATNIFTSGHGSPMANGRVLTVNGGTLVMTTAFDARFGNVTLNNGATWTSNRVLTNYDALLANTDTGAATVRVTGTGASTMNGTGGIHLQGVQNFDVADVTSSSATDLTVSMVLGTTGTIGGANGGLNKTGLGTMAITSNSTFLGAVTVNAGTLLASAGNTASGAIGSASSITVNSGGTIAVGGDNSFVGYSASGTRTIQVNTGGVLTNPGNSTNHLNALVLNGGTMSASIANATYANWNLDFGLSTPGAGTTSAISGGNLALTQAGGTIFDVGAGDTLNVSTLIAHVTGSGDTGLIKNGAGILNLSAANTYTGLTTINAGSIVLASTAALPSPTVTVASGALFDVSALPSAYPRPTGTTLTAGRTSGFATDVNGSVAINGGTINIAGVAPSAGTLSLNGNLSFVSGFVKFDLANLTTSGGGVNDQIAITGDLSLGGLTDIVVNKLNGALTSGTYTLMTYTGSLTGNESNLQVSGAVGGTTRQSFTLDTTSTPGSVLLTVAGSAATTTWTGSDPTTPGVWDVNLTDNWTSSIPDLRYFDGDNVVFDNTAATFTVDLPDAVIPGAVTFNNSAANPYVIGGAGAITGLTGLTKNGDGNVGINLTNTFTGPVAINAGSITVGTLTNSTVNGPLGAGSLITLGDASQAGSLIYTGATASTNRPLTTGIGGGALNIGTSGVTLTQSGAITLGGTLSKSGAGDLTLTATASGTGGMAVSSGTLFLNAAQTYTGGTTVNGGTLLLDGNQNFNRLANSTAVTVNNTGLFEVRGVNALPSAANSVSFTLNSGGILRFVSGASAATGPAGVSHNHVKNLIFAGGTLDLTYSGTGTAYNNESVQLNGDVTVNGSSMSTIQTSTTDALSGLSLSGARTFTVNDVTSGTDLLVSAEVENMDIAGGGLIKSGAGTMILAGTNTYTGNTTVNAGTLGITGKLYKVGFTATPVVQLNGGTLDLTSWGYDTTGSLGELAFANARVVLNGGTISVNGNSETSGRGFTLNAAGGSFLMGAAGQTLTLPSHVESTTLALAGPLNLGGEGNIVVEKFLTGTANLTKVGGGTVTLSAINTYTGNIAVNGGNLTLADNAGLKFVITNSGSNGVSGSGTFLVNGDFTLDTAAVTNTTGTWTLVNASTLSESFGSTFTITGSGWSEASNVWTKTEGTKLWTFTEATGVLTLSVANTFNTWMAGYDFSAFPGADLTPTGDADGDGIPNSVEFVIGNLPNQTKVENLPTMELVTNPAGVTAGDYMKFTFRRSTSSVDAGVTSTAQYDADLLGAWTNAVHGTAGVEIVVVANPSIPGNNIEVYIPRSLSADGRLFGRISVNVPAAP